MLSLKVFLGVFLSFGLSNGLGYEFNTSEYFRMPSIYRFDNYEECMGIYEDKAFYCIINTYIKPNEQSELYGLIKDFSGNRKQHFRHDKLQRGLCMNKCWKTLYRLGNDSGKYFVGEFPMDSKIIYEFVEYFNAKEHRHMYDVDVNKCINVELENKFNLSGFSSIEYCIKGDMRPPLDWLDILTAGILLVIVVLVTASSLFDRFIRNTISLTSESHYKSPPLLKCHQILTLFSLRRNWNILSQVTKPEVRDFRFIQAIRAITMGGVIIGHCGWFSMILPSYNPIFIEDLYTNFSSMLVVNGINIVQSFFVIGGFLTGHLFLQHVETDKSPGWVLFSKSVILRYIRFAPLLLLAVLMHSTWLYRLGSGPVWDKVNFAERQFCRKNWWINLLFLDNYLEVEMKCLVHSWYLAADFWLSALAVLVLIIINKRPALKYWIFSFILGAAAFITAYVTYVKKLEPITIFAPENLRNQYFEANETDPNYFKDNYAPTHMNIGNYFIGVFVGVLYYDLKKQKKDISKMLWYRFVWYLSIVVGFAAILAAYFFYNNNYEKPAIWIALVAVVLKHSWGVAAGFAIIGLIYQYGWFMPNVFNYPGWRVLGRISYASFVCHLFVLKVLMSGIHQPMYLSIFNLCSYICAVFGLSSFIGFLLTLSIEIPISTLCKIVLIRRSEEDKKAEIPMDESAATSSQSRL